MEPITGELVEPPAAATAAPPAEPAQKLKLVLDDDGKTPCPKCGKPCKPGVGLAAHVRTHGRKAARGRKAAAAAATRKPLNPLEEKLACEYTPSEVAYVLREMARKARDRADNLEACADAIELEKAVAVPAKAVRS